MGILPISKVELTRRSTWTQSLWRWIHLRKCADDNTSKNYTLFTFFSFLFQLFEYWNKKM
jgi:hypothetical protein